MNDDEAFLRAILDRPDDDAPRLVYADYLEERGDPRGTSLRQVSEFGHLLTRLATDPEHCLNDLDALAGIGQVDTLMVLLNTLRLPFADRVLKKKKWPNIVQVAQERIRKALALAVDLNCADALLLDPESWGSDTPAMLASVLASGRPPEETLPLIARHIEDVRLTELLACLAQELVLRGCNLVNDPGAKRLASDLRVAGHPLATLPLTLTDFESELVEYLPRHGGSGSSWTHAYGESSANRIPVPIGEMGLDVAIHEVRDMGTVGRISAVLTTWIDGSNGHVESRVFRTERPLCEADISTTLLESLQLEALAELDATAIQTEFITPARTFSILFSAACNGGAYSRGRLGAYGRLDMWNAVSGLAGAPEGESIGAVADLARQCVWISIDPTSDWFCKVAWDFGLIAIRPDRQSLAALMATDTD